MKYLSILLAIGFSFAGCTDEDTDPTPVQLSDNEKNELLFLLEEEKLARDVYEYSDAVYDQNIFNNIASSEDRHMNEVDQLLTTFGISHNLDLTKRGVFDNQDLQALYNDLTKQSDSSYVHALTVGALIEDLDIQDLEDLMAGTSNADILSVASKLQCGSRNHIRSYTSKLTDEGQTYTPSYISIETYNAILSADHENCGG